MPVPPPKPIEFSWVPSSISKATGALSIHCGVLAAGLELKLTGPAATAALALAGALAWAGLPGSPRPITRSTGGQVGVRVLVRVGVLVKVRVAVKVAMQGAAKA